MTRRLAATEAAGTDAAGWLYEWLTDWDWPHADAAALAAATREAVTNAARHAYPPGNAGGIIVNLVPLTGPNGAQRVTVTVTDQGTWRTPPPRHDGNGLRAIRRAVRLLSMTTTAAGTHLKMISGPRPTPSSSKPGQ